MFLTHLERMFALVPVALRLFFVADLEEDGSAGSVRGF